MATFEELKAQFTERTTVAEVLLDQQHFERHAELDRELAKALQEDEQYNRDPLAPDIRRRLEELEAEAEANVARFVFRGIGNGAWIKLQVRYPPSKQDRAAGFEFDPAGFCAAAVAASCVDPELSVADATWLFENLPDAEWSKVWRATLTVNLGESNRPKSLLATLDRLAREESSTTSELTASLDPSFSAE